MQPSSTQQKPAASGEKSTYFISYQLSWTFGHPTNAARAARAAHSAEARAQRHICPWEVLLEWQSTAFGWETLPRDHPQSLLHLLMYFKHRLACSYSCKTKPLLPWAGQWALGRLPLHPGRAGAPQLGRNCSRRCLIGTAELSQAASSPTPVLKGKKVPFTDKKSPWCW